MIIKSSNNETIKKFSQLKQKKHRNQTNLFLIEGYNLIEEALNHNLLKEVFILENNNYNINIKQTFVSSNVMQKLASTDSIPPIIGVCKQINYLFEFETIKKIIILENLQDPGNLGTIIRTAVAFDFDAIVLSDNSVDIYNEKVIRATQGAIFKIPIITKELLLFIQELKKNHFFIVGTSLKNAYNLETQLPKEKIALVFGNEGRGISDEILNITDINVKIPINNIESLNVAIAAGICMYHYKKPNN